MDLESDEQGTPKFGIITPEGRSRSSRGYTGPGIATYVVDEEGNTENFAGEYVGGIRHGAGEYLFSDGSQFNGSYENNKKSGLGDATYKTREVTEEDGNTLVTFPEGDNIAKEDEQHVFCCKQRHAAHCLVVPNGMPGTLPAFLTGEPHVTGEAKYLGHFVEGARQTQGCMVYRNGDVYEGEWLAGQKHGEGSYRFSADGSVLSGRWVAGSLKRGRWILPTGAAYVGEFELNKPSGKGAWVLPGGSQLLVEYTQQRREASHQGGSEDVTAEEGDGNGKYEIEKMHMRCICSVATRE
ncbi:hypothetical protein, conserved [Eimeria brunetti]|uniref:MORN repeat-containing protein n=1 Tax=Eimeria brunetti TaxID=51314 RepID=U6LN88_9EIME|nr:hypothetical protein, conserved [Eimeria brunetti]